MSVDLAELSQIGCDAVADGDAAGLTLLKSWVEDKLVPEISETVRVITLDGVSGAGKSTLGQMLADAIDAEFMDLDDYLAANKGAYYDHLDVEGFLLTLSGLLAAGRRIVVSGILMEKVFAGNQIAPRQKLYVVRTTSVLSNPNAGEWLSNPDLVNPQEEPKAYIARMKKQAQAFLDFEPLTEGTPREEPEICSPVVDGELVLYNHQYRPLCHADLVVKVNEAR